jgi:hypothetical protein
MNWRGHLPIHPAAELFPLMRDTDPQGLQELADDIAKHGLRTAIIIWSNSDDDEQYEALLDGRNRLDAAAQAGLLSIDDHGELRLKHPSGDYVPVPKAYSRDDDPFAIVLACNVLRRHLTPEQRRQLIAKLLKANPERSNLQIANQVKADDKTVASVRKGLERRSEIPNVSRRADSTGRKQFVGARPGKPVTKSIALTQAVLGLSERSLGEFKHACDHWLPKLNADDLKAARQYFDDACDKHERADGARATGSATRSDRRMI